MDTRLQRYGGSGDGAMGPDGAMPVGDGAAGRDHDIVAIVASLGGIRALARVLEGLPADFPLPVLVVQHLSRGRTSLLPEVLGRHTALHVKSAVEEGRPEPGWVHVAPPDRHLLVRPD